MSYPPLGSPIGGVYYEVQALRYELADTRRKLLEYADTIVSLHGELRTLRQNSGICAMCKQKFVLGNLVSSQVAEPVVHSPTFVNWIPASQGPKTVPKHTNSTFSWRRLLKGRAPDSTPVSGPPSSEIPRPTFSHISPTSPTSGLFPAFPVVSTPTHTSLPPVLATMHGNPRPASIFYPPTITTSHRSIMIPPNVVRWSAKRDDETANLPLAVTFVRAFNHKAQVQSVRFSADGKYLAATLGERDSMKTGGVTFVYDVKTGAKKCELAEYASRYSSKASAGVHCVCFSPSGRYLVVGDSAGCVTVWDIPNKRIRNIFRGHKYSVESVDFSPNGRLIVSVSWDDTVRIWNMRDRTAKVFTVKSDGFWSVRFSPNGQYVATGTNDGDLRIWDVRTGQLVNKWTGHKGTVWSVAFTPDGRGLVSGSGDRVVKCWDVSSLGTGQSDGEPVATKTLEYRGHTSRVYAIAVSPDAQWIASGLSNRSVVIWDANSAVPQYTLIGHEGEISSVDFSPKGNYLALGSLDHHVTLWKYTGT